MTDRLSSGREQVLAGPAGNLLEINVEAEVGDTGGFTLERARNAGSLRLIAKGPWPAATSRATLAAAKESFGCAILLDRGSIEVFGNNGRVAISRALAPRGEHTGLSLTVPAASPPVKFPSIRVYELRSAWKN